MNQVTVKELLEQLAKGRRELDKLSNKYKSYFSESLYKDLVPFSDYWLEELDAIFLENYTFTTETGLEALLDFSSLHRKHGNALDVFFSIPKDSVELTNFKENIFEISGTDDVEALLTDIDYFTSLYKDLASLASSYNLSQISFNLDVYLGLDTVYYESSRCY